MTWLRTSPRQIRTDDDRFVVQREGEHGPYFAWGPKGSQRTDFIRPRAAWERGRALLGRFESGALARQACADYDVEAA